MNVTAKEKEELLSVLQKRFNDNNHRHAELQWATIEEQLLAQPTKLKAVFEMEKTGGEPDVVVFKNNQKQIIFCDCSTESPKGRRSTCYDQEARISRKAHQPLNSAVEMAENMGVKLLNETQYRELQSLDIFDVKTSSWIKTPAEIRKLGGALFCDRRYNTVFTYHNGASSYYAARGFRGCIEI